jgi:tRNA A-37 threonylcarbamoyl transferase component Bud32
MADDLNPQKQKLKGAAESDFCELDKTVVRIVSLEETQGSDSAPPAILPILPIDAGGKSIIGTTVAGIAIKSMIGSGGMSCVYRGIQPGINREVAVKMMHPHLLSDDTALLRFNQEAHAVGKLDHPNIVKVHDFRAGENGNSFLVMDLIEGKSLSDVIDEERVLEPERAIEIFAQACDGLQHAHSKGIIHRDLKPSNIMLIKGANSEERVKVLDFGIAKILPQEGDDQMKLTQTGEVFGSPLYMSPEQCMGKNVDQRSDVYAMGCLIYEAITGKPPFEGANAFDTFFKHTTEMPPSVKALREDFPMWREFDAVILKAMAKDPKDRYQSMTQLKSDLLKLHSHSDRGLLGRVADDAELARRRFGAQNKRSVKGILIQVSLVLLIASTAGGGWYYFSHTGQTASQSFDELYLSGQESFDKGDYPAATKLFESALAAAKLDKTKQIPALRELVDIQVAQGTAGAGKYESQKSMTEHERDATIAAELDELVKEFKEATKSTGPEADETLESLAQDINDKGNLLATTGGADVRVHLNNALKTLIDTFEKKDASKQKLGYARALHNYALSFCFEKKWKEAIPYFEKSAALKKSINSQDPANLVSYLQTLDATANTYASIGEKAKAEKLFKFRIDEARKMPGDDNKNSVADNPKVAYGKFALGNFYFYSKQDDKAARRQVTEALRIYEMLEAPDVENMAECCALLGVIDLKDGKLKAAEDNFLRAKQLYEPLHHKKSVFWIESLHGLAECAFAKKDYKTAEALYRRTLAVALGRIPQFTPFVDQALKRLEDLLQIKGNVSYEDLNALEQIRKQIDISVHGANSNALRYDYLKMSELARRFKKMKLADDYLDQAYAILEKNNETNTWEGAKISFQRALLDFDTKHAAEGSEEFERVVTVVENLKPTLNTHKQLLREIKTQLKMRMPKDTELADRMKKLTE